MDPKSVKTLLKLQRDLVRASELLGYYSEQRGDFSDAILADVEDCSAKLAYEAQGVEHILDRYLCEAVAKGGEV